MSEENPVQLENALRSLTEWQGETGALWRKALNATPRERSRFVRSLIERPFMTAVAACVVLAFGMSIVMMLIPSLSAARERSIPVADSAYKKSEPVPLSSPGLVMGKGGRFVAEAQVPGDFRKGDDPSRTTIRADVNSAIEQAGPRGAGLPDSASQAEAGENEAALNRQVIRKATTELRTADVRAAQLRIAHMIREAAGEYVQDSSTSGSGADTQAHLTLRVTAERLGAVLSEIREYGEVLSEKLEGEDVTSQMVDLDARLHNEERVEAELLDLLARRNDAPLNEILSVRSSLGQVRQSIEQMKAQRARLSKLVSLATVLVIIHPVEVAPVAQPRTGIAAYFQEQFGRAWRSAVRTLADTLIGFMWVIVGGAVWWLLLAVALWIAIRKMRKSVHASGH